MKLQAAFNSKFTRLSIALAVTVASGIAWAILTRPAHDPDQLWHSIQRDLKAGKLDSVEAQLDRLLRLRPLSEDQRLVLGQIAMVRGRDAEAIDHLSQVSDRHPQAAIARIWEGTIELRNKRARCAEEAFLKVSRLNPRETTARENLIYLYGMQQRRRELSEQFAALSQLTVLKFSQMMLWCIDHTAWDPNEVRPILEGFVHADPEDRWSRLALAETLRQLGLHDEVASVLGRLPLSDPEARAIRVRIAADQGDVDDVERLTGDDADDHPVLARMRAGLSISRRDLPGACRHLRAALAGDPHNRGVLFHLGDTLIKSGQVQEGQRYVTAAKAHDALFDLIERGSKPGRQGDTHLLASIAESSLRLGLLAEARAWYLIALERDPSNSDIQEAIYRLEHPETGSAEHTAASEGTNNSMEVSLPSSPAR